LPCHSTISLYLTSPSQCLSYLMRLLQYVSEPAPGSSMDPLLPFGSILRLTCLYLSPGFRSMPCMICLTRCFFPQQPPGPSIHTLDRIPHGLFNHQTSSLSRATTFLLLLRVFPDFTPPGHFAPLLNHPDMPWLALPTALVGDQVPCLWKRCPSEFLEGFKTGFSRCYSSLVEPTFRCSSLASAALFGANSPQMIADGPIDRDLRSRRILQFWPFPRRNFFFSESTLLPRSSIVRCLLSCQR